MARPTTEPSSEYKTRIFRATSFHSIPSASDNQSSFSIIVSPADKFTRATTLRRIKEEHNQPPGHDASWAGHYITQRRHRAIKPFLSRKVQRMVYHSYFHSIMTYGIILWGTSHKGTIHV
jgi:hypothetical protein